jgi:hypothetical protein
MIRWKHFLRIMPATDDESQGKMIVLSAKIPSRRSKLQTLAVVAAAAWLGVSSARAQENPFRMLTNTLGITTDAGEGADFVRQSRPDAEKMDYSNLTGVDKKRAPVKTPAEVEAAKAELVAEREKTNVRLKKLNGEKMDPVAPAKAPPVTDEHF